MTMTTTTQNENGCPNVKRVAKLTNLLKDTGATVSKMMDGNGQSEFKVEFKDIVSRFIMGANTTGIQSYQTVRNTNARTYKLATSKAKFIADFNDFIDDQIAHPQHVLTK